MCLNGRARQLHAAHLGIAAVLGGVSGWVWGQSAGVELAEVGVAFVAEEDVAAADVLVLVSGVGGVPVVAGEFVVSACEEVVALSVVLADEEDEGWLGAPGEAADPPSSLSPGGKPTKHPKAGRRPVALRDETHRTKQMEGNTRREIGVPSASVPYSPAPA